MSRDITPPPSSQAGRPRANSSPARSDEKQTVAKLIKRFSKKRNQSARPAANTAPATPKVPDEQGEENRRESLPGPVVPPRPISKLQTFLGEDHKADEIVGYICQILKSCHSERTLKNIEGAINDERFDSLFRGPSSKLNSNQMDEINTALIATKGIVVVQDIMAAGDGSDSSTSSDFEEEDTTTLRGDKEEKETKEEENLACTDLRSKLTRTISAPKIFSEITDNSIAPWRKGLSELLQYLPQNPNLENTPLHVISTVLDELEKLSSFNELGNLIDLCYTQKILGDEPTLLNKKYQALIQHAVKIVAAHLVIKALEKENFLQLAIDLIEQSSPNFYPIICRAITSGNIRGTRFKSGHFKGLWTAIKNRDEKLRKKPVSQGQPKPPTQAKGEDPDPTEAQASDKSDAIDHLHEYYEEKKWEENELPTSKRKAKALLKTKAVIEYCITDSDSLETNITQLQRILAATNASNLADHPRHQWRNKHVTHTRKAISAALETAIAASFRAAELFRPDSTAQATLLKLMKKEENQHLFPLVMHVLRSAEFAGFRGVQCLSIRASAQPSIWMQLKQKETELKTGQQHP
jgi:hypothetical protein